MRRRRMLAVMLSGMAGGLAGCGQTSPVGGGSPAADEPPLQSTSEPASDRIGSVALPVPASELDYRIPRDQIPAITEPAFGADWSDLSVPGWSSYDGGPLLPADSPVIGVAREGTARAYPLRVLNWHEVVNDTFAGPLLVTYCPLCGSSVTAERRVAGVETIFGVSGALWRNDLVLYDRATESLWSQLLGAAIRGPQTGTRLSLLPASLTSWGEWRETYPDTRVLLPPPRSSTVRGREFTYDYFASKYDYDGTQLIGRTADGEGPLDPQQLVLGITVDGVARAYPFDAVARRAVINDAVGGTPVVVTVTPAETLVGYDRRVNGSVLRFEPAGSAHLRADGSRWERATGRAIDGPHAGRRLASVTDVPAMFWKGWINFHPNTTVYGTD